MQQHRAEAEADGDDVDLRQRAADEAEHERREHERDQQRRGRADAERKALRRDVREDVDKRVAECGVARRRPGERFEQRFGDDAVAADGDEHGQREKVEQLRENGRVFARSQGLNTSASDRPLIWLTICPATWMPENRMLMPRPSSSPTSTSFAISRP